MFVICIVEERGDEGEVLIVPALCFLSVFPSSFHAMRPNIFARPTACSSTSRLHVFMVFGRVIRTTRFKKGKRISCLGARDERGRQYDTSINGRSIDPGGFAMGMFHDSDSGRRSVLLPLCRSFRVWWAHHA